MIDLILPEPIRTIATEDEMFTDAEHYFAVGRSAMTHILHSMRIANQKSCLSILDLPSGYGRVLRYLKAKFPDASIMVSDLNQSAVDFCVRTFGVEAGPANKDPTKLEINKTFDLIWCGSLLTHLDSSLWSKFIRFFSLHLNVGGILIFTTHGRLTAKWIHEQIQDYGLAQADARILLANFKSTGFGYANLPMNLDYGISVAAPSWVLAQLERVPNLNVLSFVEAGWNNHQDVVSCIRGTYSLHINPVV
jgi:SAM-dependent methyltransferase